MSDRQPERELVRSNRRRLILVPPLAAGLVLALTGCDDLQLHGYLPGFISGRPPWMRPMLSVEGPTSSVTGNSISSRRASTVTSL